MKAFLKKAWKFLVGLVVGIGGVLIAGRLIRGKKNTVSDVPNNDGLLADVYDNGGRAATVRSDIGSATENLDSATDRIDRIEEGNRSLQDELDKSRDILLRIRTRRTGNTGTTDDGSHSLP